MTQTKNSPPAESTWDSYFLHGESVSDDFMSEDDRLEVLKLNQIVQERLDVSETPIGVSLEERDFGAT
ncbi:MULTISPECIES: hypothetical protein [Pseudomonas]|uniref:Uncharacterized protein n=1 Tax=Pseudomonas extremorientalis TaxID=169669 RepID=A0A1H0PDB5_9PSED|nr:MULTISPECIES: hypothetical protein [Pseudomonas]KAB0521840.1 hypothetical protein F7R08_01345 [Pseudomonas extremorientalis]OIN10975.1 hypothetical protein BFN10_09830 [Pseudomonas extremorientalis]PMV19496.1 hypothetical protein C1X17_23050 [Pseudomonas sp. FW305-3-2-15-C-TSA2]PMV23290.1 hypothetical protein C1X22_23345 [Pseudomonas sp. DP16D-L5]PMV35518.1 hypothetical protein C1X21_25450 [Pseudomonas sp. FW305-3-2-15-A-LB2]